MDEERCFNFSFQGNFIIKHCYVMEGCLLDQKGIKILVHASTWFAPVLLPLIVYFIFKDRDLKRLSLQAILFHAIFWLLVSVSFMLSFVLIGIPFFIIFSIMGFYYPIKGIVYAVKEKHYEYPVANWFIH